MQSHTHKVHACSAVTCHLHFWQNDRNILHGTAVTPGWNRYRNKSTESWPWRRRFSHWSCQDSNPQPFPSWVRHSNHWAIPSLNLVSPRSDRPGWPGIKHPLLTGWLILCAGARQEEHSPAGQTQHSTLWPFHACSQKRREKHSHFREREEERFCGCGGEVHCARRCSCTAVSGSGVGALVCQLRPRKKQTSGGFFSPVGCRSSNGMGVRVCVRMCVCVFTLA